MERSTKAAFAGIALVSGALFMERQGDFHHQPIYDKQEDEWNLPVGFTSAEDAQAAGAASGTSLTAAPKETLDAVAASLKETNPRVVCPSDFEGIESTVSTGDLPYEICLKTENLRVQDVDGQTWIDADLQLLPPAGEGIAIDTGETFRRSPDDCQTFLEEGRSIVRQLIQKVEPEAFETVDISLQLGFGGTECDDEPFAVRPPRPQNPNVPS